MGKSSFSDENGGKKVLFSRSAKKVLGRVLQVGRKGTAIFFLWKAPVDCVHSTPNQFFPLLCKEKKYLKGRPVKPMQVWSYPELS